MPIVRALGGLLCAAAATALAGCASGINAEAPPGVNLAGNWKLDAGASDDPQKILSHLRAEAYKIIARGYQGSPPPAPAGPPGHRPDPLLHLPTAEVIRNTVARGDFLTVRQSPGQFVLDYGTSLRSFTPGGHSVVSAVGGVGDQTSGWKGREYVIVIKAQLGPVVTEEFGLSSDGKHLVDKLHISPWELPAVDLTRVYEPTTESVPRPTSD